FRTSSGPSNAGGHPPPVTIHTWIERFNKQNPHSFEKATTPVDAENWISHMEKIFDVMAFPSTCWVPPGSCWNLGGAGKELSVGSSQILHERDDDDAERPDKRQKSGDRHQPTSQQSSHRNYGHNNDRHGSDRRGGSDNHRSSNNNYSGSNNMVPYRENLCRSFLPCKHVPYYLMTVKVF
nr:zinc finger, CCHC-type, retrotransposon Gag domain protein [Tanacetum cinerariifolium]